MYYTGDNLVKKAKSDLSSAEFNYRFAVVIRFPWKDLRSFCSRDTFFGKLAQLQMLTRSLNFRLNRSNKNDPRRRAEPEAVTSAEEQGQLLRLNRQDLVNGQKYESVKM